VVGGDGGQSTDIGAGDYYGTNGNTVSSRYGSSGGEIVMDGGSHHVITSRDGSRDGGLGRDSQFQRSMSAVAAGPYRGGGGYDSGRLPAVSGSSSYRGLAGSVPAPTTDRSAPIRSLSRSPNDRTGVAASPLTAALPRSTGLTEEDELVLGVLKVNGVKAFDSSFVVDCVTSHPLHGGAAGGAASLHLQIPTTPQPIPTPKKSFKHCSNNNSSHDNNDLDMMSDDESEEEGELSEGVESPTTPTANTPQIYPWMRRAHSGHGKYYIHHMFVIRTFSLMIDMQ